MIGIGMEAAQPSSQQNVPSTLRKKGGPALLVFLSGLGMLHPALFIEQEERNCPDHCGHPNIFLMGETWLYLFGLLCSYEWLFEFKNLRDLYKDWLSLACLITINAMVYAVFFLIGARQFGSVNNILLAVFIPATMLGHILVNRQEEDLRQVDFSPICSTTMWAAVIMITGVLWSFERAQHKLEFSFKAGNETITNVLEWGYPEDLLVPGPSDAFMTSTAFNITDGMVTGIEPVTKTILYDNPQLVRYIGLSLFLILPLVTYLFCRYLFGLKKLEATVPRLQQDILPIVVLKVSFMALMMITTPRQEIMPLINYFHWLTYLTGFLTAFFFSFVSRMVNLSTYVVTLNLLVFLLSKQWVDSIYDRVWLHDVQPLLLLALWSMDKRMQQSIVSAQPFIVVVKTALIIFFYGLWTQVHIELYNTVPYGSMLPSMFESPSVWTAYGVASCAIQLLVRAMSLRLQGLPLNQKTLTSAAAPSLITLTASV